MTIGFGAHMMAGKVSSDPQPMIANVCGELNQNQHSYRTGGVELTAIGRATAVVSFVSGHHPRRWYS